MMKKSKKEFLRSLTRNKPKEVRNDHNAQILNQPTTVNKPTISIRLTKVKKPTTIFELKRSTNP
jgi:hypothetical protein